MLDDTLSASFAMSGWRARVSGLAAGAVALSVTGFVYAVNPEVPGHYPTCPFLALTGYYCPGCGSLRAMHALLHGDPGLALKRNPLVVAVVAGLLAYVIAWTVKRGRGQRLVWSPPNWLLYSVLGVVLAFWVLRNVPGWTWLAPT
jgi:hypothetical protein